MACASALALPLLLTLLLAVLPVVRGGPTAAVRDLTDTDFEAVTQAATGQTTGRWLVQFYAPWCGHCTAMAPTLETVALRLREEDPDAGVLVARVDATRNPILARRFGVTSYPTVYFFTRQKMYFYSGGNSVSALIRFVKTGHTGQSALDVPPPPTLLDGFWEVYKVIENDCIEIYSARIFFSRPHGRVTSLRGPHEPHLERHPLHHQRRHSPPGE